MTAARKLFIAAALLAAGFGVASLMGEPAARFYAPQSALVVPSQVAATSNSMSSVTASTPASSGARLVPDFAAANPYQTQPTPTVPVKAPALLPEVSNGNPAISRQASAVHDDAQQAPGLYAPRAKLRDEAPRPLAIEQRAPAINVSGPLMPSPNLEVASDARAPSAPDWQNTGFMPSDFTPHAEPIATIRASYSQPGDLSLGDTATAPPPWPSPSEEHGPRTHIIVDGDSLQKLAGRYLDDSRRSNEIYEANRELLASPDLLPIGAELVIPTRNHRPAIDAMSPQSSMANDVAIRAASHNAMVPVRPIPSAAGVMPRAQLSRPLPVE